MAYQAQQQATIVNIVKQCCQDESSFNDISLQITLFVQSNQSKDLKPIVDTIKKVIKDKNSDSPSKVQALKLLNQCLMQSNNQEFLLYMEKKVLKRLSILARYRKVITLIHFKHPQLQETNDIEKGIHLFGKTFNNKASSDFLKLLLLFIQKWGTTYHQYHSNGKQTEVSKVYQSLVNEKVFFPSEEAVLQSLAVGYNNNHPTADTHSNKFQSPNSSNHSHNQQPANTVLNKGQFSTHQVQINPNNQIQGRAQSFSQLEPSKPSQNINASSTSSMTTLQQQKGLSRDQQLQLANKIKNDYKKLYEYQSNAKLAEEILQMGGDPGSIDSDFLLQFRTQLTEGKDFGQKFLNTLMETTFNIKDKESKIEKIIGIINEIDTQLDKILAIKPYSPRSIKEMKRKQDEEIQQIQENNQSSQRSVQSSNVSSVVQNPQETPTQQWGVNEESKENKSEKEQLSKSQLRKNERYADDTNQKNSSDVQKSVDFQKMPQQQDFNFDKNQFKTNYVNQSNDSWFTQNEFKPMQMNDVQQPSFDFNNNSGFQADFKWGNSPEIKKNPPPTEVKQSAPIIQEIRKNPLTPVIKSNISSEQIQAKPEQKHEPIQKLQSQEQLPLKQEKQSKEEVKAVQKSIPKRSYTGEYQVQPQLPNMPNDQKPNLMQQVSTSSSLQNENIISSQIVQQPKQELMVQKENKAKAEEPMVLNSRYQQPPIRNEKAKHQFGIIKVQQHKPQITSHTPDSNVSSENEESHVKKSDEKASFQFPAENENLRMSKVLKSSDNFDWDFNNSSKNKSQDDPFSFNATQQINRPPVQSSEEKFDFSQPHNDQQIIQQNKINEQLNVLQAQLDEKKLQNEELKVQLRKANEKHKEYDLKLREANLKFKESLEKFKEFEAKISQAENDKNQLRSQLEDQQEQLKQMKKYEFLYEGEKFSKVEMQHEINQLHQNVDEYKKMAERLEHKVNKKEKELDQVNEHLRNYESKIIEMKEQHENDLDDMKKSETQTKQQLQKEIFESRKKEEDLRVELQKEIQENKKREQYMKSSWLQEMDEYSLKEQEWKSRLQDLESKLKEKEEEVEKLKKQKVLSIVDHDYSSVSSNKIVLKSSAIKFNKEASEKQAANPPEAKNDQQQLQQQQQQHQQMFDFQFPQQEPMKQEQQFTHQDPPELFTSIIKSKEEPLENVKINKFDIDVVEDHQEQHQEIRDTEEIYDNIPSSDSDKDSEHAFSQNDVKMEQPFAVYHDQDLDKARKEEKKSEPQVFEYEREQEVTDEVVVQSVQEEPKIGVKDEAQEAIINDSHVPVIEEKHNNANQGFDFNFQVQPQKETHEELKKGEDNSFWDFFDKKEPSDEKEQSSRLSNENHDIQSINNQPKQQQFQEEVRQVQDHQEAQGVQEHIYSSGNKGQQEKSPISNNKSEQMNLSGKSQSPISQISPPINDQKSPLDSQQNIGNQKKYNSDNIAKPVLFDFTKIDEDKHHPTFQVEKARSSNDLQNSSSNPLQHAQQPIVPQQIQHQPQYPSDNTIQKSSSVIDVKPAFDFQPQMPQQLKPLNMFDHQVKHEESKFDSSMPLHQVMPQQQRPQSSLNQSNPTLLNQQPQFQTHQQLPTQSLIGNSNPPMNQNQQFQQQITPRQQVVQGPHVSSPQQQQQQPPQQQQQLTDIKLNTSQFTTQNTEQYQKQQMLQQQQQQKINPQAFLQMILHQFFRKSLLTNKSVLYEDQNITIGLLSDYQPSLVRMRLFFMCKNQQQVQQIAFVQQMRPIGFEAIQTRESIQQLTTGQQEPIDISIMINSFQLSIPIYGLSYKSNNVPVNNLPIRLPVILLKICTALTAIDNNPQAYIQKWERECTPLSEAKQLFNIDFTQCRSLTQLKEVLKLGSNALAFADGVEQQKNIVCGGTQFIKDGIYALIKVTITGNGQNCEIIGRSSDTQEPGKFAKFVMGNILELIALKVNQ